MTAQERVVIEPKDIAGVEFECPRCAGRLYIPLNKFDGVPDRCPNCREVWFSHLGAADHVLFHDMIRKLKDVVDMISPPKFTLRFEVRSNEEPE